VNGTEVAKLQKKNNKYKMYRNSLSIVFIIKQIVNLLLINLSLDIKNLAKFDSMDI